MQVAERKNILKNIVTTLVLVLSALTIWMVPLPVMYYRVKLGRTGGLIISAGAFLILTLVLRDAAAQMMIIPSMFIMGMLLGECHEKGVSKEKTILFSSLVAFLISALALFFYSKVSHTGIYDLALNDIKMTIEVFRKSGYLEKINDDLIHMTIIQIPGYYAAFVLFFAVLNALLAIKFLEWNRIIPPGNDLLDNWKTPEHFVWVVIAGAVDYLLHSRHLSIVSLNAAYPVFLIYFIQGISIVSFYLKKADVPPAMRYLIYVLFFILPAINLLVAVIGLFDMWVDFRKLGTKLSGETGD